MASSQACVVPDDGIINPSPTETQRFNLRTAPMSGNNEYGNAFNSVLMSCKVTPFFKYSAIRLKWVQLSLTKPKGAL